MGREIERKFLVTGDGWRDLGQGELYRQAYLCTDVARVVRIRRVGDRAWVSIKGKVTNVTRREFEYRIPAEEADEMLEQLCMQPVIEKTRTVIRIGKHAFEVDEFHGRNDGLIVVEVELESEDETIDFPDWVGREVTENPAYTNACLQERPYDAWSDEERRR